MGGTIVKLVRSVRLRGMVGTLIRGGNHAKFLYQNYQKGSFDRTYGTDTQGTLEPQDLGMGHDSFAQGYEAITHEFFSKMMSDLRICHSQYSFIDLGSGKGMSLMLASPFCFSKIIGVELSESLHSIANKNIDRFSRMRSHSPPFELFCMNAVEFEYPLTNLVVFLYNPFQEPIMRKVVAAIERSIESHPRKVFVLYRTPWQKHLFRQSRYFQTLQSTKDYAIFESQYSQVF